jgi:prevent-host-death family protein
MSASIYTLTGSMALKNRFARFSRRVNDSQTVIPITRQGRPVMALMSWEMFESLVDTIEILSDPELMARISQSEQEIAEGKTVPFNEVLAELDINHGDAFLKREE